MNNLFIRHKLFLQIQDEFIFFYIRYLFYIYIYIYLFILDKKRKERIYNQTLKTI